MSRIAVVGSRDYPDLDKVVAFVRSLPRDTVIITGGARGVDRLAELTAIGMHIQVVVHRADWTKNGRAAGPMRNAEIVDDCDELVAFWTGTSPGTLDSIRKAACAGKAVRIFGPEPRASQVASAGE